MAGHSKWSQIKHKKARTDAQRGKIFTKMTRELIIATKLAGPDPSMNARLRLALQKAKDGNMPNDNIKRAIEKGAGNADDTQMEEVTFEAYAPDGVAFLIETFTDNKNRTVPNLRTILNKKGGALASKGAVAYQFDQKGLFIFSPGCDEEQIIDLATEGNAEDMNTLGDGSIEITSSPEHYESLRLLFTDKDIPFEEATLTLIPQNTISIDSVEKAKNLLALQDALEDDDDVQNVYANYQIDDALYQQMQES